LARRQTFKSGHVVRNVMERLTFRREDRHLRAAIDGRIIERSDLQNDVRTALQACWIVPENGPRQVSVRFSFNREVRVVGQPLITYQNPPPSEEGRAAVREALTQAIARCQPLQLSDDFRKVISVHPISVRLGEGWRRRGEPEKRRSAPR
jgi:hypothetical protein